MCSRTSILTALASLKSFQNRFQIAACVRAAERMLFYSFQKVNESGFGIIFEPPDCHFGSLLGRFLEQKAALVLFLAEEKNFSMSFDDWTNMKIFMDILEPL